MKTYLFCHRKGTNGEEFQKKIAALRINDIEKENDWESYY